ncbi:UNKNOWN [Stylonychia lemnae]|uniref:Uncharacterized protein n=1 Tax=Stylonychia lemnae TaxID=5949 RepID=A0A077ZY12_STYLE|nr:UNKNOWN [Stylonychia lemnae]|eukprot:CDW74502.1 UNKNOWN [Stylonychia lemnae]
MFGNPLKFSLNLANKRIWECSIDIYFKFTHIVKDYRKPTVKPSPNPSPINDGNVDYEPFVQKYAQNLQKVEKDLTEADEVRLKLQCQVNLMKTQVAMIMKKLHDRMVDVADIELDFKSKMVVEQMNLSFRKSKIDDVKRQNSAFSQDNLKSAGNQSVLIKTQAATQQQQQPFAKAQLTQQEKEMLQYQKLVDQSQDSNNSEMIKKQNIVGSSFQNKVQQRQQVQQRVI